MNKSQRGQGRLKVRVCANKTKHLCPCRHQPVTDSFILLLVNLMWVVAALSLIVALDLFTAVLSVDGSIALVPRPNDLEIKKRKFKEVRQQCAGHFLLHYYYLNSFPDSLSIKNEC